ncbi:hypothetical protein vseg_016731 [Gypsophila vaccaria]
MAEPRDIRNLFSSYTYQSPELDSNEDFCISPTPVEEGEYVEKELCVDDSEDDGVEDDVNVTKIRRTDKCGIGRKKNGCSSIARKSNDGARKLDFVRDAEIPANPDSLSLLSEPPDIANWFSSYAYESPELDTADFDVSLSPNHTFSNHEMTDKENNDHCKELNVKAKVESLSCRVSVSNGFEMNARSPATKKSKNYSTTQTHISENISSENSLCPEITFEASTQGESLSDCCNTDVESVLCRPKTENLMPMMQEKLQKNDADQLLFSSKTSCKKTFTEAREYTTQHISNASANDSGWIQLNHKPRDTIRILTENRPPSSQKNTTPRIHDENSPRMLGPRESKVDRKFTNSVNTCENKRANEVTREVFKETTNTQYPYAQEAAGKWRCPQKNKPNTGPPLKQLRLERWVRRI